MSHSRIGLALAAGCVAALASVATVVPAHAETAGRYIVVLTGRPTFDTADVHTSAQHLLDATGGRLRLVYSAALRGFSADLTPTQVARIDADPAVSYVQPNGTLTIDGTENNPPSWGLDRIDQHGLPLDNSYTYPNDGSGVTAYDLDTGIRATHQDFGGRATVGYDAIGDGQNGNDCHGHGTHTAGTIGGSSYGVAKQVGIVAVRVLNCQGSGTSEQVVAGIDWVTKNARKPAVANMSLGGSAQQALDDAVRNSIASGVVYSVAAGNNHDDACKYSPARVAEAITMAASDSSDASASFTNTGRCVRLYAPGVKITSSYNSGDTATKEMSGTSMATPHATGSAALYLSAHPNASPKDVADALVNSAAGDKISGVPSDTPNLLLYVGDLGAPDPTKPHAAFSASCSQTQPSCDFDASASTPPQGGSLTSYAWDFGDGVTGNGVKATHQYSADGQYTVTLTVTDDKGATASTQRAAWAGRRPPSASFTVSCQGAACAFDASNSQAPGGSITSYAWAFGDGATGGKVKVNHTYTPERYTTYTATLTVTDDRGKTATASQSVRCFAVLGHVNCQAG